jgi:multiple sugar transport system ATP-binding protein
LAKVVLDKVYKSFPSRDRDKEMAKAPSLSVPTVATLKKVDRTISKSGNVNILRSISLSIEDGEFMVLVGPSGCGKSTLLRLIAGLEELTGGNIWVGDRLVNDLAPKERDIAMVFQNYALYPHLNVYDNIAFGLRRMYLPGSESKSESAIPGWAEDLLVGMTRKLPRSMRYITEKEKVINDRVRSVAQLLQIEKFLDRLPKQLSGGQKQRVALGRAIARNPQVFLMDEPLSNLDAKLRAETRSQIVKLQRQLGTTTIYVTHDRTEAMTMGDRIAVMDRGEIQQIASPLEIYNKPVNRFVAEFIGSPPMNFIQVQVQSPLTILHSQFRLTLPEYWANLLQPYYNNYLLLGIRPEHLSISPPATKNLPVEVDLVETLGNDTYIAVRIQGEPDSSLQVRIPPDISIKIGDSLWLSLALEKIHLFDPHTNRTIS